MATNISLLMTMIGMKSNEHADYDNHGKHRKKQKSFSKLGAPATKAAVKPLAKTEDTAPQ